jgi:hypothetical protein
MKERDEIPMEIRMIVPFAEWLDRHPTCFNLILWLMGAALVYTVWTYDFTTSL